MKQTSISAYRDITDSGRKKTHSERIYAAMLIHGAGTYEQIATYADMQDRQVCKRLSELEREGKIRDSGRTSVLSSGKHGTIWELVPMWGSGNGSNETPIDSGFLSQINDAFKRTNELVSNAKPKDPPSFSIADFNKLIYASDEIKKRETSWSFPLPRVALFPFSPFFNKQDTRSIVENSIVPFLTKKKQRNVPIPETTTFKRWVQLDLFRDN